MLLFYCDAVAFTFIRYKMGINILLIT